MAFGVAAHQGRAAPAEEELDDLRRLPYLLALMRKFRLCHPLGENSWTSFVRPSFPTSAKASKADSAWLEVTKQLDRVLAKLKRH
jgi:hypothetical protein